MGRVFIVLGILCVPALVFAAPYYEFAPDYSEPLSVPVGTTVSQKFAPLNDRLVGIDLWVSTGNQAASIVFTLRNPSGTAIATRTVALGAIPDTDGGTRRSITLDSQVSVSGGEPYTFDVTPSGAPVKLYKSSSVSIAPGSGTSTSSGYRYGAAIVDGQEQGYSFTFALTEAGESTAPAISDVQVTQPSIGSALVSFTASEPVDVQIVYGSRTVGWTGQYSPCLPGISRCSVYLRTTPGIAYAYTLSLKDSWGNVTTTRSAFTAVGTGPAQETPATPTTSASAPPPQSVPPSSSSPTPVFTPPSAENVPPQIINPRLLGVSPTTVTVAWTTDESANSVVNMLGEAIYVIDPVLELEHFMTISGLLPDHYYRMRVSSTDFWGNRADILFIFITPLTSEPTTTSIVTPGASPTPVPSPSYTVEVPASSLPPPTIPPTSPTSSPTTSAAPGETPSTALSPSATATPTPSVVAYPSTSTEPGEITWEPADGDYDGYRIDIFDEFGNLITTLTVGKDVTSLDLPAGIPKGARVIVYADRGGAFEKVGVTTVADRPAEIPTPSYTSSILIIGGGVVLLAVLIGLWLRERRKQKVTVEADISIGQGGAYQTGR